MATPEQIAKAVKEANRAIARDLLYKGAELAQRDGGFIKTLAQGVSAEYKLWVGYQITIRGEAARDRIAAVKADLAFLGFEVE